MSVYCRQTVLLPLAILWCLSGCSSNYKFNDASYRPLGDPYAIKRIVSANG